MKRAATQYLHVQIRSKIQPNQPAGPLSYPAGLSSADEPLSNLQSTQSRGKPLAVVGCPTSLASRSCARAGDEIEMMHSAHAYQP